jgi:hypothetical protein
MAADKRGQIEVFARNYIYTINYILFIYYYIVNHPFFNQLLLITDINLPGWIIQLLSCFGGMLWIQNGWPGTS